MNKEELININGIREDLYQAMQIGDITLSSKNSQKLVDFMNYQDKEIERLNNIIKTKDEGIKAFTEDLCEESAKVEKAIEYIKNHTYHDTPKKLQNGIYERGELIIENDFYIEDLVDILRGVVSKKEKLLLGGIGVLNQKIERLNNIINELKKENKQLKKELPALEISEEQWLDETLGSDE